MVDDQTIDIKKPESKIGICSYHLCRKKGEVFLCNFCERYYCKKHSDPKLPDFVMKEFQKKYTDIDLTNFFAGDGHPCFSYIRWAHLKEQARIEKVWEILNILKKLKEREFPSIRIPGVKIPKLSDVGKSKSIKIKISSVLVVLTLIALFAFYFYKNPDKFDALIQVASEILNKIIKGINVVFSLFKNTANRIETTTTTIHITPTTTTTTTTTIPCCCLGSCDKGGDCGRLESCFGAYVKCPNSYCE